MKRTSLTTIFLALILLTGCSSAKNDPFEGYNRAMHKTNKVISKFKVKGYDDIVPDVIEHRVTNFFSNLGEVNTFANSVLQGKLHNATASSARFVWNTTLGLGGLFDVATAMKIKANKENFGQTLRTWGMPEGPYLVLPIIGPSTVTDTIGQVGDYFIAPSYHYNWPSNAQMYSFSALKLMNKSSKPSQSLKPLNNKTIDEYSYVKELYLQKHATALLDDKAAEKNAEGFTPPPKKN